MLLVASFVLPPSISANSEYIHDFQSKIKLNKDNAATVTERITYDFGGNERRGIHREIPVRYFTGEEKGFEAEFDLQSVERSGVTDEEFRIEEQEDTVRIRIGDPDEYIGGRHTYVIRYTLQPVALAGETEDIFRLDVTGNGWEVPVRHVSTRLVSQPDIKSTTCYTGKFGEDTNECTAKDGGTMATYATARQLSSREGLTIEAAYDKGSFSRYPEIQSMRPVDRNPKSIVPFIAVISGFAVVFLGGFGGSYIRHWRRRANKTVIPQYEPPASLAPAEIGLLSDNTSDTVEFTALLINLAVRGYLEIEQEEKRRWLLFTHKTYRLHKKKPFDDLEPYERDLLEPLFDGSDTADLEEADGETMQKALRGMHKDLVSRLEDKGYYREKKSWLKVLNLKKYGKSGNVIGVVTIIAALLTGWYGMLVLLLMVPVAIASWQGGGMLFSRITHHGYETWAEIEGFKEFLTLTQKERLDFHDAPERNPEQFSEYLPYAIALGVEKKWAKQFEDIDVTSQQHWYRGANMHNMSAVAATSSLSNGLKSYSKSNFSSSSSTGSGGSFSGGGVGGGGGGSW